MILFFFWTVLNQDHVLGADYFALKVFSKSFVSIMKLASYLSIVVSILALQKLNGQCSFGFTSGAPSPAKLEVHRPCGRGDITM